VVALAWLAVCLAEPCWTGTPKDTAKPRAKFTLGRDTTCFTEPLDKDGYVDYASALNAYFGKGVKAEENAYVPLINLLGPAPEGGQPLPNVFFQALGIPPLPVEGDYFLPIFRYLTQVENVGQQVAVRADDQLVQAIFYPWQADDYPLVALWLRHYEARLDRLKQEMQRPRYFRPLVPSGRLHEQLLPDVQKFRSLSHAYLARAMLRTRHGLYQQAWDDLLASKRLGQLVGQGSTVIEALVGITIQGATSRALVAYLAAAPLDAATWQRLQQQWRSIPAPAGDLVRVAVCDRVFHLEVVQLIHRGESLDFLAQLGGPVAPLTPLEHAILRAGLDWEEALRTLNRWCDRFEEVLRERDRLQRNKRLDELDAEVQRAGEPARAATEKFSWLPIMAQILAGQGQAAARQWGLELFSSMTEVHRRIAGAFDRLEESERLMDVAFALARYRDQVGKYPERLEQLVPQFLPRIEPDIFSGKPPIYRRSGTGYVLYSVGPNGQDDGGRTYEDNPRGDDIVIRMPPTPPVRKPSQVGS